MKIGLPGIEIAAHLPVKAHMDIAVGIVGQILRPVEEACLSIEHVEELILVIRVVVDDDVGEIALPDDVGGIDQSFVLIGDEELGGLADRELPVQC